MVFFDKIRKSIKDSSEKNLNKKIDDILDKDDAPTEMIERIKKSTAKLDKLADSFAEMVKDKERKKKSN